MSRWRLIDSGQCDASFNMALDEALAKEAECPVLRFYGWTRTSVSIGCFQDVEEVDLEYMSGQGMPLVRRITGGRGILHGPELTYSFSAPITGIFRDGLRESYAVLGRAFADAFKAVGLEPEVSRSRRISSRGRSPICFESSSVGEIKVGGRKVVGSAQKRWPDRFMQQGSIPFHIEKHKLLKVFRSCERGDTGDSMAGLIEVVPSLELDAFKCVVVSAFEDVFGIKFDESVLTTKEEALARELKLKYDSPGWNLRRQRGAAVVSPLSNK